MSLFFLLRTHGWLVWTKKDVDRQVLLDLYRSTDGDNWTNNHGWDGDDLCSAYGIECDFANGFVTKMYSIDSVFIIKKKKKECYIGFFELTNKIRR